MSLKGIEDVVDAKSPAHLLTFQKGNIQYIKENFNITSTSCCVCQESFSLQSDFDNHLRWHGKRLDYPLAGECENREQIFQVSYKLCVDSYFIFFTLKSAKSVTIEKIVIIRPELQKSINYVNNENVPFCLREGGIKQFYVNCFLFNIGEKQPFVIVYKYVDDASNVRRVEQHLFLRENDFPKCSMKLISTRVPQRGALNLKKKLKHTFPCKEVRRLSKVNYKTEDVMNANKIVGQFLLDGKLNPSNFEKVLSFLLQVEDHSILSSYLQLSQRNKAIKRHSYEYSVTIKSREIKGNIRVGEIAKQFDDIIVSFPKDKATDCGISDEYYDDDIYDCFEYLMKSGFQSKDKNRKFYYGMIHKIAGDTVYFALRQNRRLPSKPGYEINILPQRHTIKYQHYALEGVAEHRNIRRLLFPTINVNKSLANIRLQLYNKSIESNPEQLQAVKNIVEGPNASAPYIIFGPPGTGKTTTVVESVFQLWKMKPSSRILITAGSNAACDEVARRLCRIFEEVNNEGMNLLRIYAASAEKRMDNTAELLVEASNFAHGSHFYPSLDSIYLYRILVVTFTVAGKLVQGNISPSHFTHVFIDECASSTEPEAMTGIVGLMSANARLILSGDPKQLGPILNSAHAVRFGLGTSMMERLLNEKCYQVDPKTGDYDRSIQTRLIRNFRTHPKILHLFNNLYYNNELIPCAKKELTRLAIGWHKLPSKGFPIIFHAIKGVTKRDVGQTSLKNHAEIDMVMHYVCTLMKKGLNGRKIRQEDIGIISPYRRQCDIIRQKIDSLKWFQMEVGSVEIFQGKEKPIIIISPVRSSNIPGVGFLDSPKRINVTLSRAQALMIIIGNPNTLQKIPDWQEVIRYCHEHNAITGMAFTLKGKVRNVAKAQLPNVPQILKNPSTCQIKQLQPEQSKMKSGFEDLKKISAPNTEKLYANSGNRIIIGNEIKETAEQTKITENPNKIASNSIANTNDPAMQRLTSDMKLLEIGTLKEKEAKKSTPVSQLKSNPIDVRIDPLSFHTDVLVPKNKNVTETRTAHGFQEKENQEFTTDDTKENSMSSEDCKGMNEVSTIPPSTGAMKKNWCHISALKSDSHRNISITLPKSTNYLNSNDILIQSSSSCPKQPLQENVFDHSTALSKLPTQIVRPLQQKSFEYPSYSSSSNSEQIPPARSRKMSHNSFTSETRYSPFINETLTKQPCKNSSCTIN